VTEIAAVCDGKYVEQVSIEPAQEEWRSGWWWNWWQ